MSKEEANYTTLGSCAKCEPSDWKDLLYSQQIKIHYKDNPDEPIKNVFYYIKDKDGNECYGTTDASGLTQRFFTEKEEVLTVYIGKKAYHHVMKNKASKTTKGGK